MEKIFCLLSIFLEQRNRKHFFHRLLGFCVKKTFISTCGESNCLFKCLQVELCRQLERQKVTKTNFLSAKKIIFSQQFYFPENLISLTRVSFISSATWTGNSRSFCRFTALIDNYANCFGFASHFSYFVPSISAPNHSKSIKIT